MSLSYTRPLANLSLPVAYLGYGRHGKCHGRNFQGGAKIAWHNKNLYLQFLEPLFWAPYNHKLRSYTAHPYRTYYRKSGVLRQLHQAL